MESITIAVNSKADIKLIRDVATKMGFEVLTDSSPNATTVKAIADARTGKTIKAKSAGDLFKAL